MAAMAEEVERKFLIAGDSWQAESRPEAIAIRQFYVVAEPDRSVRIRIMNGEKATLTLKFGAQARVRQEFEYPLALDEALGLQSFAIGNVIEKTRNIVPHGGFLYEVDVFGGALAGLVIAELETDQDVPATSLPPWLGREVTGDSAYYNASLALKGFPETRS
ncbi:CYTH domain-containing protein [Mesorhizobium sp. J18]|nr:CYTH domain-containing protein [Mesorhizobium sp. J18]